MRKKVRIAIAGLGTVGAGCVKLIQENADLIARRSGAEIIIAAVSARDSKKDRGLELSGVSWKEDPTSLIEENIDIIVELIGGSEGAAKNLVEKALHAGKHVVTANKALIAHHGVALAQLAEEKNVVLAYEAAVAGGIPVIGALRDGLGANRFEKISGILNGTCNYILTTMQAQGREFEDVLSEAQALGYAEADPSFDIDGIDTAHKLAILASLAFGVQVNIDAVSVKGIRTITKQDIHNASELGCVIKLLGIAEMTAKGLVQYVCPTLVLRAAPIAQIDGAFNAVQIEGNAVGRVLLEGRGAGAGPTASSVVADIIQIARGASYPAFTVATSELLLAKKANLDETKGRYYLRLHVREESGVLAQITAIFAQEKISVKSLIQHDSTPEVPAQVVITTHETLEASMMSALHKMQALDSIMQAPQMIRMES